jgi:hypothetical protein
MDYLSLSSSAAMGDPVHGASYVNERTNLEDVFRQMRPEVLDSLREHDIPSLSTYKLTIRLREEWARRTCVLSGRGVSRLPKPCDAM